ncbi:sugar ABC transporter permease [Clostridium swellfunianum]|uniref:carbohydrate ABC transporter permease n=1 Tax=Clostridium swellfunianum TaxID=1367462 RepID=UPI00202F714D|nr:sugar ABC transporter permease [Clostridium swellfunianum]MCM0649022.1 sugar ABC transporter permease [Clostridium swellfunianum]
MEKTLKIRNKSGGFKQNFKEYFWCYVFIAVPVLMFLSFTLYPLINAFIMSFQKYNVMGSTWIGLDNYKAVFKDSLFRKALVNTVIYTIGTVPVNIMIALGLALLIFQLGKKTQTFFKAAFYLPAVTSGVTLSLVWFIMYDPTPDGLLNKIISVFGVSNINWLGKTNIALFSLMLMTYLGGHGSGIILYLASLGGIPKTIYEAADIDAASTWSKFKNITWPLLKPTTLYMFVTGIIGSFQVFMTIYLMTGGGPDNATTTIAYLIYQHAFSYFEFGHAAAESFVLAIIIIAISILQFKYLGSDVEY